MALAWPDHDTGPVPPPDHEAAHRRDLPRRKKLAFFDRVKFLWAFALIFAFLAWREIGDNPILSVHDALVRVRESTTVLQWLAGLELLRQLHYLLSERSGRWHHLVSESVFGRWNRFVERRDPWTRFRVGRMVKLITLLVLVGVVLGATWDVPWYSALFEAPGRIGRKLFETTGQLPMIFQIMMLLLLSVGQIALLFWFLSRGGVDVYRPDDIETRFSDVWGQDPVLTRVKESIVFLEQPRDIEDKGGYVPGGILLWGPPGTGKTLLAEAVAGETGRPFVFVDPGAFQAMFMGVGILKVKSLFRKLRKLALRYGGVIVFFDEADSLGNRGNLAGGGAFPNGMADSATGMEHLRWLSEPARDAVVRSTFRSGTSVGEPSRRWRDGIIMTGMGGGGLGTLQALLTELSGLKKPRGWINRYVRRLLGMRPKPPPKYRILTMMATNLPQALDEALLRPGRIDRIYKVGYPSKDGRKRTYQGYFDKVSHELTDDQLEKLAVITPYATGASIKDLVNESLIMAIRDGRQTITWADVVKAKHLKTLGPGEDVEYVNRERHAIAVHEACHAVAAYRLRRHLEIDIATIEKGGTYLGMVSSIPPEDQFTLWRSEYEVEIKVSVASLAGERLLFGSDNSSGVSGDLDSATTIATLMEGFWGMGETLVSYRGMQRIFGQSGGPGVGGGGSSGDDDGSADSEAHRAMAAKLGERVESNLRRLFDETEQLLRDNRGEVLAVAHALETYKTLSGEDVTAVMEGTVGPLVDGRIYRTAEFVEAAERYHAVAVAAHTAHGAVDEDMPDWRPPPPEPAPLYGPPAIPPVPPPGGNGSNGGPHPAPAPPTTSGGPVDYPTAPPTAD